MQSSLLHSSFISGNAKTIKGSIQIDNEFPSIETCRKIRPIPRIHAHLQQKQYNSEFNKTFSLKGYKHISTLVAVGEQTHKNLKRIKRSSLKVARSIEFDAYLCDNSGLKGLVQILMKLRSTITNLDLRIRRADKSKEVENLSYCLTRLLRLTKRKLELASSLSVSQRALKMMGSRLKMCYGLKSVESRMVYLQNAGQRNYKDFAVSFGSLLKLEELAHNIFTYHSPQNEYKDIPNKISNLKRVKKFLLKTSAKTGWTSMTDGAGQFLPVFIRSFPERINPIHFSHIFTNLAISTEAIEEYAKMIPQLLALKHFLLEFSYCKLGELELMVLGEGFTHCKQIEHLTFKFIERTPIPFEYVVQFVKIIAELCSFSSFDLFFRKLEKSSEQERHIFENILSHINNVESILTKESLHVFKK